MYVMARAESRPDGCGFVRFSGFVCKRKIASATLVMYRTNSRLVANLEDVEVVQCERGKGYGRRLLLKLVSYLQVYARAHSESIELKFTSRPSRVEANHLYQNLGFQLAATATSGGTNLYKMTISPS